MPRRPVVLLTSPRDIPKSSLFIALLHQSVAHPLLFQSLAHSLCVYSEWPLFRPYFLTSLHPYFAPALTPLDSALTADLRVLTEISRNRPPTTSLESTLTKMHAGNYL